MPVMRSGEAAPEWCELEHFDIVRLKPGEAHRFERAGRKEKLIVGAGRCRVAVGGRIVEAERGANLDLSAPGERFEVREALEETTLVRMCGRWGEEVGGSGLFPAWEVDDPKDCGDPVAYPKRTAFDNHYHDCDEYWIVISGRGVAVSEGRHYEVGPGDCVATRMGDHHDLPIVHEPITAVFFETTLGGRKRPGHLWQHTHG